MKRIMSKLLLTALAFWVICPAVSAATELTPGGQVIGLALKDSTLTVSSVDAVLGQAAEKAGVRVGDQLVKVNGAPVESIRQVRTAVEQASDTVELSLLRGSKARTLRVKPAQTQDGPRLGLYLKEGVTGIGTVTYYDPQTGEFGALGHGVNTPTGDLVAMEQGTVFPAKILSVKKGLSGTPGQLMGTLQAPEAIGQLDKNTTRGIFGTIRRENPEETMPIASADQIHTGAATIRSTVDDSGPQEYSVEILKIYPRSGDERRNMLLKVTDETLLETTGGIVQGMSGSPIIQDGKLVGAVTHVLVNDPTTGYGIFIENMLNAAA